MIILILNQHVSTRSPGNQINPVLVLASVISRVFFEVSTALSKWLQIEGKMNIMQMHRKSFEERDIKANVIIPYFRMKRQKLSLVKAIPMSGVNVGCRYMSYIIHISIFFLYISRIICLYTFKNRLMSRRYLDVKLTTIQNCLLMEQI
ncbi:hypothetical protein ES288_A06G217400v1 [Gossypium darwinii]|uniref:Uncharacterized protein n=1 Tax=Gossypium darwinii TaxID=34276 RepID=A0A5D2GAL8_GOSDA|nr:hypothetical protein ES288_A06G217400v1 [Gossypium darwinii]